jgi:hypothetical protein
MLSKRNANMKMKTEHLRQSGNNIVFLEKNNCKDYVIIQNYINQAKYFVLET